MSYTCGNPSCSVSRHPDSGKLFCAEVEISSATEVHERKTVYLWLCDRCARQMKPDSEIAGEVIRRLLTQSCDASAVATSAMN